MLAKVCRQYGISGNDDAGRDTRRLSEASEPLFPLESTLHGHHLRRVDDACLDLFDPRHSLVRHGDRRGLRRLLAIHLVHCLHQCPQTSLQVSS